MNRHQTSFVLIWMGLLGVPVLSLYFFFSIMNYSRYVLDRLVLFFLFIILIRAGYYFVTTVFAQWCRKLSDSEEMTHIYKSQRADTSFRRITNGKS